MRHRVPRSIPVFEAVEQRRTLAGVVLDFRLYKKSSEFLRQLSDYYPLTKGNASWSWLRGLVVPFLFLFSPNNNSLFTN
jgi:hypothetical protein